MNVNIDNEQPISRNYHVLFKDVKTLSEYDTITETVFKERTPKQDRCLRTLFLNLLYSHIKGYSGVYISSNRNSYKSFVVINGVKYRNQVYYEGVMHWINGMVENGYIIHHKGCNTSKPRRKGWVEITEKFISQVGNVSKEDESLVLNKAMKKLIILRDIHSKEEKVFKMDGRQKLIEDFIKRYNEAMNTQVDVKFQDKRVDCDVHRLYLGEVGVYGRFHSNVVNMKKEDRKKITISGERVVEVDYTSSHLAILYAEKGLSLSSLPDDPYDILRIMTREASDKLLDYCIDTSEELGLTERDVVKVATMIMINTQGSSQALQALCDNRSEVGKLFNRDRGTARAVLDAIEIKHHLIKDQFFSNRSMDLMTKESNLMLDILVESVAENGLPVIPLHDGVLCTVSDTDQVREIMKAMFNRNFGVICNVKIK